LKEKVGFPGQEEEEEVDFPNLQDKLEALIVNHLRYVLTIRICSPNNNVFKVPLPYGAATGTAWREMVSVLAFPESLGSVGSCLSRFKCAEN